MHKIFNRNTVKISYTLRCLIEGEVLIAGGSENFLKCNKRGGLFNGGGGGGGGIFQKSEKHDRKYDRRIRVLLMDF